MSNVVGKRTVVFQGNDVDKDVTCCERARWIIADMEKIKESIHDIEAAIHPVMHAGLQIIYKPRKLELNYCPVCGDKYKEAKK